MCCLKVPVAELSAIAVTATGVATVTILLIVMHETQSADHSHLCIGEAETLSSFAAVTCVPYPAV
jgi:hypothetical protein